MEADKDSLSQGTAPQEPLGIEGALEKTERRGEALAAGSRLLIASTVLLAAWSANSAGPASHPLIMASLLYTLISLVGLAFVLVKFFHPALPYIFVVFDSAAIAGALTMQARMHGMGLSHEFSLPLFSLAFVVLIHAAMRYRPSLVIFGAGIFITFLFLFPFLPGGSMDIQDSMMGFWRSMRDSQEKQVLHDIGFLPLVFLTLAAFLLYYIVRRTRSLARLALLDGRRVAQLARFFSPEVASRLVQEDENGIPAGRRQNVAVLFVDIRGFTHLSEGMTPEELTELLASFRDRVCQIIFEYGGSVDKFIGDAVLVVFGTPDVRVDDAERAVKAVFAISRGVHDWYQERKAEDLPGALVGIGAHYGEVFAGVIETGHILEHSVIGDAVNVAQRLERCTRTFKSNVALSDQLLTAAGIIAGNYNLVCKKDVHIRGHSAPVTIFHDAEAMIS